MFLNILTWLVIGIVVGLLARLVVPGKQAIGIVPTVIIGILGALLGGFVSYSLLGVDDNGGIEWIPLILAVIIGGLGVAAYTRIAAKNNVTRG